MSVRDAVTVVGTVVGAYFGYPQLGYAIGSAVGNAVDPQTIKGPSLGDIARQTSMEGVPRPIVWALSPPIAGNIIASSEPKIVRKRQRQGKGGPKVETEHVYRTYAIGVCEGPITRFVRIWRNNTLVFDVSEFPQKTHEENIEFLKHARFFLGSWNQNPSPALEKIFGVGTTPSHRGTAYMVMDDEDLTDLRGAIPQYQFQVERCEGFFVTSRPYSALSIDAMSSRGTLERDMPYYNSGVEPVTTLGSIESGTLITPLATYNNGLPEEVDTTGTVESGELVTPLAVYDDGLPEEVDTMGTVEGGDLDDVLIIYEEYPPEEVGSTGTIESGSLV